MAYRALITGVSGFVGGYLAGHLLDCGDTVLGVSPDGQWMTSSPDAVRGRLEVLPWDLAADEGLRPEVRRAIERFRPQVVYHLAAISVPEDCGPEEPTALAWTINVEGTLRVLDVAASLRPTPRVLYVSSSYVYGPVAPQAPRVDESAPLAPKRGYGRTKLAAEEAVRRAVAAQRIDAVIVRAFQHTGPGQSQRMMLPEWASQFASGGRAPVRVHTLNAWIDLCDVRDVVRAYRLVADQGERGGVYNVGSGVARRSGDIFEHLRQLADPGRPVVELRPGFKHDPIADITRLQRLTGWRPSIPLEQTVRDTFFWWRDRRARAAGIHKDASP